METDTRSDFTSGVTWRDPARAEFQAYGIWPPAALGDATLVAITRDLAEVVPNGTAAHFVAFDEGWPFAVGVFDIELPALPDRVTEACAKWIDTLRAHGASQAWMMFDGAFNDARAIFADALASQTYAVSGFDEHPEPFLALDDEVRSSSDWRRTLQRHRQELLKAYPSIESQVVSSDVER